MGEHNSDELDDQAYYDGVNFAQRYRHNPNWGDVSLEQRLQRLQEAIKRAVTEENKKYRRAYLRGFKETLDIQEEQCCH